jgi:hypothetical protein
MRKTLACVAVVLVLAGGLVALLGPRHCPVNRAAFERIEEGMTRAEVHAVLGGPPGDYRTQPPYPGPFMLHDPYRGWNWHEQWEGDEGLVRLNYSRVTGGVVRATFHDARPYDSRLLELARWRLRKLKGTLFP